MPKGVYNRGKVNIQETIQQEPVSNPISHEVGINKIRVSQMPDRQSANANVESVLQTHGGNEVSTSERLFGDIAERDRLDEQDPNRVETIGQDPLREPEPVAQNPEQAEQQLQQQPKFKKSNSPEPEPTPTDEFIDWEKMQNMKIRQKIDGKEVVITADELKKYSDQDQIKKHLAEAADKVGQERRKLAEERLQLQELRNQRANQYQAPLPNQQEVNVPANSIQQVDPVFQRIQFLEAQVQQLAQGVQPSIYESNRQRVSNELKAQGFNDFIDYLPKMEMAIGQIKDPNLTSFYDTPEGSKALYFQLKAQDLQKTPIREIQTQVVPRGNPTPPQTQIDSGSQPSGSYNDDENHTYRAAFKRAVTAGDDREAWNDVLRRKGILPD